MNVTFVGSTSLRWEYSYLLLIIGSLNSVAYLLTNKTHFCLWERSMCGSGSLETCGWVRTHISSALGGLLFSESH